MFGMFESLAKAAVGVVVVPVNLVVDVVTLPASSEDPYRGPFDRTGEALGFVLQNLKDATNPDTK